MNLSVFSSIEHIETTFLRCVGVYESENWRQFEINTYTLQIYMDLMAWHFNCSTDVLIS